MKSFRYILLLAGVVVCSLAMAQNVSDVTFYQEGKSIVVTYSLDKTANVSVQVSMDGGATYSAPLKHVSGDVGKGVTAGAKQIVWDVLSEYDNFTGDNVMFLVTAEGGKRSFTVNGVTFNMIHVQVDPSTQTKSRNKLSDFYIGETEVTQALWEAVMGTTIEQQRDKTEEYWKERRVEDYHCSLYGIGPNHPMYYINRSECNEFVQKLSMLTGVTFRLPTEAEWEFAARGGNMASEYKYSGSNNIEEVAWYYDNSGQLAHAVAMKKANGLGIYDMTGNVEEWCSNRRRRGGEFYISASYCRISYRGNTVSPSHRSRTYGLRLVLVP